mmetsp:Transcript_72375/g.151031  ORF Transcript_72375/g.151031 Transcript_72375/m.151031 type:complete len:213 (+) Transcript_72375:1237-1875(+)
MTSCRSWRRTSRLPLLPTKRTPASSRARRQHTKRATRSYCQSWSPMSTLPRSSATLKPPTSLTCWRLPKTRLARSSEPKFRISTARPGDCSQLIKMRPPRALMMRRWRRRSPSRCCWTMSSCSTPPSTRHRKPTAASPTTRPRRSRNCWRVCPALRTRPRPAMRSMPRTSRPTPRATTPSSQTRRKDIRTSSPNWRLTSSLRWRPPRVIRPL